MERVDSRTQATRARLLEAGLEVFARDGFRGATIERICKRAKANIAAAHYHFGDKRRLYAAVFEHAERHARADPLAARAAEASPEERLHAHVASFLRRLLDPGRPAWMAQLLAHELIDPTPALDRLVRRRMRANHDQIAGIIRELVPGASAQAVRLATLSVVAQCVFYRNSAAIVARLYPDLDPKREIDRLADHVTRFSLAGLASLRGALEGRSLMIDRLRRWATVHRGRAAACVVGLAVLVLAAYRLAFRPEPVRAAAERPVSVAAEPARTGDIAVHLDGIGTVTPVAVVTVHSRVDGELMAVHFEEGQMVARGDLLAEIDPRPFQVQLAQAQGQLARDQALLENAKVDVQRYRALVKDDAIPKQQLDTQEALVHQYDAALAVDRGQIDAAQLNLVYSRVTAPVAGRVGFRLVDPGNLVHASDTGGLAVVTQLRPIDVVFTIPEDALPDVMAKVRTGVPLAVDALDRDGATTLAHGTLLTVDNTIDPATGTVRLKGRFANDDDALFPNQFVNARLELDVHHGATLVPEAAVQRGTQGAFVWVVKDDHTVDMRPITPGVTEGSDASLDGVDPGELVVVEGAEALRPGTRVALQARRPPRAEVPKAS